MPAPSTPSSPSIDRLTAGPGGWLLYRYKSPSIGAAVAVAIRVVDRRRLVAEQVVVTSGAGVSRRLLQEVPLGKIDAWVNTAEVAAEIRARINDPVPAGVGGPAFDAMFVGADLKLTTKGLRKRFEIPQQINYGDDFYRDVATTFAAISARESAPAKRMALDNDVPVSTVHRWVREARSRGFLPPGRAGKAS